MTPKERVIASFKALCDRTEGGVFAVAESIGASAESLQQVYNGYKLPSGAPRGIGPDVQRRLEDVYPGWATTGPDAAAHPWPFRRINPSMWSGLDPYVRAAMEEAALQKMREIELQERAESPATFGKQA